MIAATSRARPLMSGAAGDEDAADESSGAATVDSGTGSKPDEVGWASSTIAAHSACG